MKKEKGIGLVAFIIIFVAILIIGAVAVVLLMTGNKDKEKIDDKVAINDSNTKTEVNLKENNNEEKVDINATIISQEKLDWLYQYADGKTSESHILDDNSALFISPEDANIKINNGELIIPETVEWNGKIYTVTTIFNECFSKKEDITSVSFPDSITRIDEKAFYQCKNIKTLNLSKNLVFIGSYAFAGCESLVDVVFPTTVTDIRDYAFASCISLEKVDLSNCSLSTINEGSFRACTNLNTVKLPKNLTTIETYAFNNDISLKELEIPDTVSKIETYAFSGTENCVLYVSSNSKAQEYAIEQGMQYKVK